jgi:tripartite-type tricarboxylate transporter receptor subunit TctC
MKQLAAALLALAAWAAIAQAPAWPARPVHVVVSLTPGSATDILARTLSERLSKELRTNAVLVKAAGIKPN